MIRLDVTIDPLSPDLIDRLRRLNDSGLIPSPSLRLDCGFGGTRDYQEVVIGKEISGEKASLIGARAPECVQVAQTLANEGYRANRWHIWAPPRVDPSKIKIMMSDMMDIDDQTQFELFRQPDIWATNISGYIDLNWFMHTAELLIHVAFDGAVICGHMANLSGKIAESWRLANGEKLFRNEYARSISERLDFMAIDINPVASKSYIGSSGAYVRRWQNEIFDQFRAAGYDIAKVIELGVFEAVLPEGDDRVTEYQAALVDAARGIDRAGVLRLQENLWN